MTQIDQDTRTNVRRVDWIDQLNVKPTVRLQRFSGSPSPGRPNVQVKRKGRQRSAPLFFVLISHAHLGSACLHFYIVPLAHECRMPWPEADGNQSIEVLSTAWGLGHWVNVVVRMLFFVGILRTPFCWQAQSAFTWWCQSASFTFPKTRNTAGTCKWAKCRRERFWVFGCRILACVGLRWVFGGRL